MNSNGRSFASNQMAVLYANENFGYLIYSINYDLCCQLSITAVAALFSSDKLRVQKSIRPASIIRSNIVLILFSSG